MYCTVGLLNSARIKCVVYILLTLSLLFLLTLFPYREVLLTYRNLVKQRLKTVLNERHLYKIYENKKVFPGLGEKKGCLDIMKIL